MKEEKSYIELEKEREKSEWKSEETEIVNSVDISDGKKEIVKYSTVTYKNMVKWIVGLVIGLVLIPFTDCLLLPCRIVTDVCMLINYPTTLLY